MALMVLELMVMMAPMAHGILCYNCVSLRTKAELSSFNVSEYATCSDPFQPDGVPTCESTGCFISWYDLAEYGYFSVRACSSGWDQNTLDHCEQLNVPNATYQFFKYEDLCCYTFSSKSVYNGTGYDYTFTFCFCLTDNCNGAVPNYIGRPASTVKWTGTNPGEANPGETNPGATRRSFSSGSKNNVCQLVYGLLFVAVVILV